MKTKSFKRIFALTLLLVLCLSLAPAAYAAPVSGANETSITKSIVMNSSSTTPAVTYTYTFTAGPANTTTTPVILGNGPAIGSVDIEFTSTTTTTPNTPSAGKKTATQIADITLPAATAFGAPGVYRYTVAENRAGTVQGLNDDTPTSLTFDVYVGYIGEATTLSILGTVLHKSSAATPAGADKTVGFTAQYTSSNDLTIKKTVSGTMGDKTKDFEFAVNITGVGTNGVSFDVALSNGQTTTVIGGTEGTITLKHDQQAVISGLPETATCTVTEEAVTGYTTTFKINGGTVETGNEAECTMTAATVIEFINSSGFTPPTGISMDMAPFAALILLAVLGLALPVLKKKTAQR